MSKAVGMVTSESSYDQIVYGMRLERPMGMLLGVQLKVNMYLCISVPQCMCIHAYVYVSVYIYIYISVYIQI